jgi:hypothetical protein
MNLFTFWPIFVQHAYVFGAWLYFIFHASVIMSALTICHVRQRPVFQISTISRVRYAGACWDSHNFSLKLTQHTQFENIIKEENNVRNNYYRKKNYQCLSVSHKYNMKFLRTKQGIRDSYISQQIHLIKCISWYVLGVHSLLKNFLKMAHRCLILVMNDISLSAYVSWRINCKNVHVLSNINFKNSRSEWLV